VLAEDFVLLPPKRIISWNPGLSDDLIERKMFPAPSGFDRQ
jgi:hypothetical protein